MTETLGQICCICSYKKAGLGKTVWVMMTTCLPSSKYQQLFFSVLHLKLFNFFSNLVLLFRRVRPSSSLALLYWGSWKGKEPFSCPVFDGSFIRSSLGRSMTLGERCLCFWGSRAGFPCQAFFPWAVPFPAHGLKPLAVPQAVHRTCRQPSCCSPGQYAALTQQPPPSLLRMNHFSCSEQSPLPYSQMRREKPHLEVAQQGASNILSRQCKKRAAPGY